MKIRAFWNVIPCIVVNNYQNFGDVCCLALNYHGDEGSKLLPNVGNYFTIYAVPYVRSLEYLTSQDAAFDRVGLS